MTTINTNELGTNAKRMLEIGIVQDELVKLGCKLERINDLGGGYKYKIDAMTLPDETRCVVFWNDMAYTKGARHCYTSPTWQEDLINKVKELINDNK